MPISNWSLGGFSWSSSNASTGTTVATSSADAGRAETGMPGGWGVAEPEESVEPTTPRAQPTLLVSEADEDDDAPPAFPALNSIQRSSGVTDSSTESPSVPVVPSISLSVNGEPSRSSGSNLSTSASPSTSRSDRDALAMPPPSFLPSRLSSPPSRSPGSAAQTPPFAATSSSSAPSSSLLAPLSTSQVPPNTNPKKKARSKVALTPGHSPLDWARLKSSGEDLRCGITQLMPITLSELKEHRRPDDAWSAFYGKVYNITPYLPFHPGGEKELMRAAGRDGTKLFALTHSWVNLDFMLDGCMIGFLVPDRAHDDT